MRWQLGRNGDGVLKSGHVHKVRARTLCKRDALCALANPPSKVTDGLVAVISEHFGWNIERSRRSPASARGTIHGYCYRILNEHKLEVGNHDVLDEHQHQAFVHSHRKAQPSL